MRQTDNIKLKKHESGEKFDYTFLNYNADIIDTEIIQAYEMGETEYIKYLLEKSRLNNANLLNEIKTLGQAQTDLELELIEQGQYITDLELQLLGGGESNV